jgi:hypothetical protein
MSVEVDQEVLQAGDDGRGAPLTTTPAAPPTQITIIPRAGRNCGG